MLSKSEEPVRIVQAVFTFIGAIDAVLIGSGLISATMGAVVVGVVAAANQLAQEIFGRANVEPEVKAKKRMLRAKTAAAEGKITTQAFPPAP